MSRAATNNCFLCERGRTEQDVVQAPTRTLPVQAQARAHADVRSRCTVLLQMRLLSCTAGRVTLQHLRQARFN
jgi:hypothetical protein